MFSISHTVDAQKPRLLALKKTRSISSNWNSALLSTSCSDREKNTDPHAPLHDAVPLFLHFESSSGRVIPGLDDFRSLFLALFFSQSFVLLAGEHYRFGVPDPGCLKLSNLRDLNCWRLLVCIHDAHLYIWCVCIYIIYSIYWCRRHYHVSCTCRFVFEYVNDNFYASSW